MFNCKKLVSLLLVLALCAVSPTALAMGVIGGSESSTDVTVETTDDVWEEEQTYYFYALCNHGGQLYANDYYNLYELSLDNPAQVKAVYAFDLEERTFTSEDGTYQAMDPVMWIASDGKDLYGFQQSRQLCKLTIQGNTVALSEPIAQLTSDDSEAWFDIGGMVVQDGAVYILISRSMDTWGQYDLWEIPLDGSEVRQVASGAMLSLCAYKPGTLLIRYWDQDEAYSGSEVLMPTLCSLDIATGEMTELLSLSSISQNGMAYDPATDTIYTSTDSLLYRSVALGEEEACAYINLPFMSTNNISSALIDGKYYVVDNGNGGYAISETDPAKMPKHALKIAAYFKDDIMIGFTKAHPEIPVVTQESSSYTAEQVSQEMISGSDACDVYLISNGWGTFEQLRDKGYCVDLSTSDILMEQVSRMNPQFTASFFQDGKLWAFPSSANASGLGYSPSVLEKIGLTEEDLPRTLLEYMDFAVAWLENYAYDYADLRLLENVYDIRGQLFNQVLQSYATYYEAIGQTLDFDTPLMHKLLEKLDQVAPILEELNPEDSSSTGIIYGFDDIPSALFSEYCDYTPQEYSFNWDYQPLLLSLDEGMDPVVPMNMSVYIVNPNSENADLAVTFLEYVAEHMTSSMEVILCPDANDPVEDPYAVRSIAEMQQMLDEWTAELETADEAEKRVLEENIEAHQQYLKAREEYKYLISPEDIATYREVEPFIFVPSNSIFANISTDGGQLLQRYMDGQISSDQFIKEFNRILRMMQMEDM